MNTQNISKGFILGIPKNSMDFLGQKTKQFCRLFMFSVFAFLVLSLTASFALADDLSISAPNTLTQSLNTTFTITITGNSEWNVVLPTSPITITDGNGHNARINLRTTDSLNNVNSSETVTVNASLSSVDSGFYLGSNTRTVTINAYNSSNTAQNISRDVTFTFANTYCDKGQVGNRLEITSLSDNDLDNANDWEWAPRNNIELELRIRNNYQDDITANIVYGLYDKTTGDFIFDDEQSETLNSRETTDVTLTFQIPVKDLTKDNYDFYVKAYDDDEGEDLQCADKIGSSYSRQITIKRESRKVTLDNVTLPTSIQCGSPITMSMEAFNIGRSDEKKVKIVLSNTQLNLNQEFIINNLDKGDSKKFTFPSFLAPLTANEGSYPIAMTVYYNYNSANDEYRSSDNFGSTNLVLSGNCKVRASDISISVSPQDAIQSGGRAGDRLVVKVSVSNLANRSAQLVIQASGYEDWATLDNIAPASFSLNAGTSQDILFTFSVNKDVKGEQTFNFEVDSDNQKLKEQTVSVPIEAAGFSFGTGSLINSSNWYLWAIGAFNIILVIIIIIVAIRVAKK